MERLIENLNQIGFHFTEHNVEGFECLNTRLRLTLDFGEYELSKGSKAIRFKEFDFEDGEFRCFVCGTIVFECYQDDLKDILG